MGVGEGLDAKVSDVLLDEGVLESDLGDLDLGLLWDEIHLSFSFLKWGYRMMQFYLPLLGV